MSDYVVFEHDRIATYGWSAEKRKDVSRTFNLADLRLPAKVAEGVTLGDIFKAVGANRQLTDFISIYSWCEPIEKFHQAAEIPFQPEVDEGITYLEKLVVKSYGELWLDEETTDFNVSTSFSAIDHLGLGWSISCTPMSQIAHLPVEIDEKFVIRNDLNQTPVSSTRVISVLDFLDAIYWDISFHGGPEDNKEFLERLEEQVRDLRGPGEQLTCPC